MKKEIYLKPSMQVLEVEPIQIVMNQWFQSFQESLWRCHRADVGSCLARCTSAQEHGFHRRRRGFSGGYPYLIDEQLAERRTQQ